MIQQFLMTILNISIRSAFLIACLYLIRKAFNGRANRAFRFLWILVAVRLLIPFTIAVPGLPVFDGAITNTAKSSIVTSGQESSAETPNAVSEQNQGLREKTDVPQITDTETPMEAENAKLSSETKATQSKGLQLLSIIGVLWVGGAIAFAVYNLASFIRLRRQLAESVETNGVMRCDHIGTSFVFGLFRPRIYVPSDLEEEYLPTVVMHEKVHIRRGDYLAKVFYTFVLMLHWFNPMVWLAFRVFDRDMELACDDAVTRQMNREERNNYLRTILACSSMHATRAGYLTGFADGDIKERIRNIDRPKRYARIICAVCMAVGVAAMLVSCASGKKGKAEAGNEPDSFIRKTLVCGENYCADIQPDGTVRITLVTEAGGTCEIYPEEVKEWKDIVSLRAESGILYGFDRTGKIHYSSMTIEELEGYAESGNIPMIVPQSQLMYAIPKIKEVLNNKELIDANPFAYDMQKFLTKDGNLIVLSLVYPEEETSINISENDIIAFEETIFLRKDGTIGTTDQKASDYKGYKKLKELDGVCGIAENANSVFALKTDGSVTAGNAGYVSAVSQWKDVKAIRAFGYYIVALHTDGRVSIATTASSTPDDEWMWTVRFWRDIVEIDANERLIAAKKADGEILTVLPYRQAGSANEVEYMCRIGELPLDESVAFLADTDIMVPAFPLSREEVAEFVAETVSQVINEGMYASPYSFTVVSEFVSEIIDATINYYNNKQ